MGACCSRLHPGDAPQPPPDGTPQSAKSSAGVSAAPTATAATAEGRKANAVTAEGEAGGCHVVPKKMESPDEEGRLRALRALQLIGTPPRPQFDAITALMKQLFDTPVAAISLIDEELYFISRAGDWACSAGREGSFCDWMLVTHTPQMLVVEDALADTRFKHNKFVSGEPHIRFYAGAPLVSSYAEGHRYGSLCVLDFRPRRFDAPKYAMLAHFAEIVVREMERELMLMLQQREMDRALSAESHLMRTMDAFQEAIILLDLSATTWRILYANDTFRRICGMPNLLASASSGVADGTDSGGSSGGPADFWQLFSHVTNGTQSSHNNAMLAMASGKDFSLSVRPTGDGNGAGADAACDAEPQPCVLHIRFRPADNEQLCAAMPHIGIPAWLDVSGEPDEQQDTKLAASGTADVAGDSPAASPRHQKPVYYFGIVRHSRKTPASVAGTAEGSPLPSARTTQTPGATTVTSEGAVSSTNTDVNLSSQLDSRVLPAFIQMRPEVVQEVQLGPLIGIGSMGRCYRGMWQGGRVAVKIIECWEPLTGANPSPLVAVEQPSQGLQSAVIEALLARSLSHPHIVTTFCHGMSREELHDACKVRQQVWIVQEYCSRGSLLDAIDSGMLLRLADGAPNLQAILLAAMEIAGACAYLHGHDVIHGDLTPSNILLTSATKDQRRWVCKVADFGLAKHSGGAKELHSSSFGTVTYMPPELLSAGKLSKSADVYSFGIILLEMWYGQRAWLGLPPLRILAKVSSGLLPFEIPVDAPQPLASIMRRCLDLEPGGRPTFSTILGEVQNIFHTIVRGATRGASPQVHTPSMPSQLVGAAQLAPALQPNQPAMPGQQRLASAPPACNESGVASPFAAAATGAAFAAVSPLDTAQ